MQKDVYKQPYNKQQGYEQNIKTNIQKSKYYTPKWYKEPEDLCTDSNNRSKKCLMTKKKLCMAISHNFIVRNNIIAAILTTIPRISKKNGKNIYDGGLCFQKFLNLEKCSICIPDNPSSLKINNNLSEVIMSLLDKSRYIDKTSCQVKGKGIFLQLTDEEKKTLMERAYGSEEDFKLNPSWKGNKLYLEFMTKLKNKYFESLNFLILILEELKSKPFVSNSMLNQISMKTKNVIDDMYNYVNYYYIYSSLLLIKSDYLKKSDPDQLQLNKIVKITT